LKEGNLNTKTTFPKVVLVVSNFLENLESDALPSAIELPNAFVISKFYVSAQEVRRTLTPVNLAIFNWIKRLAPEQLQFYLEQSQDF